MSCVSFLGNEINEFTKALGEWIRDDSGIPIRRRGRGMNEVIVGHLVEGNPKEKKAAFKQALNVSQVRGVVKDWLAQIARSRL